MLRLVVADYYEDEDLGVETGTCDLCMGQTDIYSAYWKFKDLDTDDIKEFDSQEWDYGDVYTMPQCSNIPAFSQWLSTSSEAQKILEENGVHTVEHLSRYDIEDLLDASGYTRSRR